MNNGLILEMDEFLRSIEISKNEVFAMLLGAGASISSGIQSANECIWEWKKDIYVTKNPNASSWIENYKMEQVKEVIQKWINNEGIYLPPGHPDEYSFYVEKCYPIEDDRRKYFQRICEKKEPSIGYRLLCLLAELGMLHSVWTTNFDNLTLKAATITNITAIDITLDCVDRIIRSQNRSELLHIGLHGDYRYGPLKNTSAELQTQDKVFREKMIDYLNDKHLIVIGYSGRDKSLMDTLQKSYSQKGSGRLYWCGFGREINQNIEELIQLAKNNGRNAFFVPTDGFDKLMIRLTKSCLKDNNDLTVKMNGYLKNEKQEIINIPFDIEVNHINGIIKSNVFPISIPKDVFQFEIDFHEDEKPWAVIKELTANKKIVAVPYKKGIWSFGTLPDIEMCFKQRLKSKITRKPLTEFNLHKETSIYCLLIYSLTRALAEKACLNTDGKDLLWGKSVFSEKIIGGIKYNIYEAIRIALEYDGNYYLAVIPTFEVESSVIEEKISKEVKQEIGKWYFEKMWNKKYNDCINKWRSVIFSDSKDLEIEYPLKSGTGFIFELRKNPAFAKIMKAGTQNGVTLSANFPKGLLKYKGIQYKEPDLIFASKHSSSREIARDYHPMRGLINNRPYDFPLNGTILNEEIKLGIICPINEAEVFSEFINRQLQKISSNNINQDYLLDYPGFYNAYGISLNIPSINSEYWVDCPEPISSSSFKETALDLARKIRDSIDDITKEGKNIVVVIYIPDRWKYYIEFNEDNEYFDLHDYIKAFCAEKGVATQFIRESTINSNLHCQINWWLSLAFYVKSLRTPWILDSIDKTTAFAGIGYSVKHRLEDNHVVLGCSHIFNSEGQGLKYKLSKVDDPLFWDKQKNPHLSYQDAFQFGLSIKELFYTAMSTLPKRVVIHKRTYFSIDEINGIKDSLIGNGVETIDLIELNYEDDIRFISSKINQDGMPNEADSYAVMRGTCILLNEYNALLWSHGVAESVRNPNFRFYLGGRYIPTPLRIIKHYGQGGIGQIANEILGLTKMNWNTFNLYSQLPATVYSSNEIARIGRLLSRREGATYDYRYFI